MDIDMYLEAPFFLIFLWAHSYFARKVSAFSRPGLITANLYQ